MVNIGRGLDRVDQAYFELDQQSFEEFVAVANDHDNRVQLLEDWMTRKELEMKKRVSMPTP